ncbi:hypothetical protein, partial [Pseudomonas sp. SLFW]|uniref:hypothetical protein n=1 Tax=Pseudomonas sp. SLFW TaxID=2683259 RepID=UPI001C49A020
MDGLVIESPDGQAVIGVSLRSHWCRKNERWGVSVLERSYPSRSFWRDDDDQFAQDLDAFVVCRGRRCIGRCG